MPYNASVDPANHIMVTPAAADTRALPLEEDADTNRALPVGDGVVDGLHTRSTGAPAVLRTRATGSTVRTSELCKYQVGSAGVRGGCIGRWCTTSGNRGSLATRVRSRPGTAREPAAHRRSSGSCGGGFGFNGHSATVGRAPSHDRWTWTIWCYPAPVVMTNPAPLGCAEGPRVTKIAGPVQLRQHSFASLHRGKSGNGAAMRPASNHFLAISRRDRCEATQPVRPALSPTFPTSRSRPQNWRSPTRTIGRASRRARSGQNRPFCNPQYRTLRANRIRHKDSTGDGHRNG